MSQAVADTCTGIHYVEQTPSQSENNHTPLDTVICLHGIGGDDTSFAPQLASLSNQYRIIAWNMPGYRNSEPLKLMSFDTLSDKLLQLIQALNLSSVHLIGQSIGGMIAMESALKSPQHIKSLSLIATTSAFGGRDDSFKKAFLKARLTPLDNGQTMPELATQFIPEIVGPETDQDTLASAELSMSAVPKATYKQVLSCLVEFNRREEIAQLNCPVCLIAGELDNNAPWATMEKMSNKISNAEFHVVRGAGHLVNIEKADETTAILRQFLENFTHVR